MECDPLHETTTHLRTLTHSHTQKHTNYNKSTSVKNDQKEE